MNAKAAKKIDIATGRIVTREPFFASIILGLTLEQSESVPTLCTNGIRIAYNPDFVLQLDEEELIGVLCHEVEHVARLHPWRRGARDLQQWNQATDYSINEDLISSKFSLPKGALVDSRFNGKSEEQIYGELGNKPQSQPGQDQQQQPGEGEGDEGDGEGDSDANGEGDGDGEGNGDGEGEGDGDGKGKGKSKGDCKQPSSPGGFGEVEDCPGTQAEKSESEERMKVEIIRAATVAKSQGRCPGFARSMVEQIKHPPIDWRDELRDFMTAFAKDDFSWTRPNRRYLSTGFILPSLHSCRCGTIALAWDTSGSIGQTEIETFSGVLRDVLETVKPERILWLQCDAAIGHYQVIEHGEEMPEEIPVTGGGGTSFIPVFERIETEQEEPECLIYLTDGYGTFPDQAPSYPVLWCMTSTVEPPFGKSIHIEI